MMQGDNKGIMRADLAGTRITVTADAVSAPVVKELPGAMRTAKYPPFTWHLPLTYESIDALRRAGARVSPELVAKAKQMLAVRRYVESQKRASTVTPLRPIPVKPGIRLYNHQVKAYNIVLALYGYPPMEEGDQPCAS